MDEAEVPYCTGNCGCGDTGQFIRADECWADPFCRNCAKFGNNFTEEEAVGVLAGLGFEIVPKGTSPSNPR